MIHEQAFLHVSFGVYQQRLYLSATQVDTIESDVEMIPFHYHVLKTLNSRLWYMSVGQCLAINMAALVYPQRNP